MWPTALLARYIGAQFLKWFFVLLMILAGVIFLFELVEMVRRTANREAATFAMALRMTVFKLPSTVELLFHFTVLFAAMFTFWRLTRSQELIVTRAAGVSALQFLWPVLLGALFVGVLKIAVLNPVSAAFYAQFEELETRYIHGRENLLDVTDAGIWLRQLDGDDLYVIHANRSEPDEIVLHEVMIMLFDSDDRYRGRIDAAMATLEPGQWAIESAWVTTSGVQAEYVDRYALPTDLSAAEIRESFASPETLSFWTLPRFIEALEATGFSSLRHQLHYYGLMAHPFLLAAMVLFAAAFALRHTTRGGALPMVVSGVLTGFCLFILTDIVTALGLARSIPVALAAVTPAVVGLLLGFAALFHLEDG